MRKRLEGGLLLVLFLTAGAVALLAAQTTLKLWQQPLGEPLGLAPLPTASPPFEPRPGDPTSTAVPAATLRAALTPTGASGICGASGTMLLLGIGSDARADSYVYGLADVIRVARVDFSALRVTVLEFPRDLWVEIPGIASHYGITHEKLNQAYLYGNPGMGYYDGPGAGPGLLARTLETNFGIRVDHYAAINMKTFVKLVDAVDGIDVVLGDSVDGRAPDQAERWDLYFRAGPHHLDGQAALTLARIREHTVFERTDQQNLVLCALRSKLLQPSVLPRLPELIAAFDQSIQTDLSPEQLSQLACLATQHQQLSIQFASFPAEHMKGTRVYDRMLKKEVFVWEANMPTLRLLSQQFAAGSWPEASNPSSTPSAGELTSCP